jgi:GNAT superfamily N-acetyltransferase
MSESGKDNGPPNSGEASKAQAPVIVRAMPEHLSEATRLLHDYFDVIGVVLRDDAAAILAFLTDPASAMWIAHVDGQPAGCVALRPLQLPAEFGAGRAAECKRLYVDGAFRRRGVAEALMAAFEAHAADTGYGAVYLDSKDDLHAAIALYRRLGYADCPRYNTNPQATVFMRKEIQ